MPLDPQAKTLLDRLASMGGPAIGELTPVQARANAEARPREPGPEVARVEDRCIPGPDGEIPVRVYTPTGAGPFPVLVWFHGGGWVVGSIDGTDGTCRHLANGAGCVVVSVGYQLAPEAKFPAPAEDCYAATSWVADNSAALNTDPQRSAVGGSSAGGNLAAVVALMARDRGGPLLVHQLLVYPVTERNFDTESYRENGEGYGLSRESMAWYWDLYLRDDADAEDPYAAPMMAQDLSGLPPALVITAEFDPLRDEGESYARRLREAGVPTTCTRYEGMIHAFFNSPGALDKAQAAIEEASSALTTAFAGSTRVAL